MVLMGMKSVDDGSEERLVKLLVQSLRNKEYGRQYYEANKEYWQHYHETHVEEIRECNRRYY